MSKLRVAVLAVLLLCASCSTTGPTTRTGQVLFVGNSQLYVGNMPAVFAALASANGHPVSSDMIVRGGASLAERVADGTIAAALRDHPYAALVVQERGGSLLCAFGPQSCVESRQALKAIAGLGREHGVPVVLLGSYQSLPDASRALVEAEADAAAAAGVAHVEVSETLRRLRESAPDLAWLYSDGSHPGKDLTLLDAMLLYRQLYGALPEAKALTVNGPIYTTKSGLEPKLRSAHAPAPRPGARRQVGYPAAVLEVLIQAIGEPAPDDLLVDFSCANGESIRVHFLKEPDMAVLMRHGDSIELPQQRSGSGFIYSNGPNTIRGKGDALTVEIGRMVPIQCTAR